MNDSKLIEILQLNIDADPHARDTMSPELWQFGLQLYKKAWGEYLEAGCPFGESDEALLVWYTFNRPEAGGRITVGRN
jgi:hypothetical protein